MQNTTNQNQQQNLNWLEEEEKNLKNNNFSGEKLPGLKLEENKITVLEVDFSKPWQTYTDEKNRVKAIIPVMCNGQKQNWWLNKSNPVYAEIVKAGRLGQTLFSVFRTGQQDKTRYTIVKV